MKKGKPFLEVLSSAVHEDYRFPILEVFAFLYTLSTFVFAGISFGMETSSNETVAYSMTASILGMPLIIFVVLIFKNIAYGLGSDLEKGIIQTYFTYPLKRWQILTAKLLSALGIALVLFLTIQISVLYILAPNIVLPYLGTVLLTYAAFLSPYLLVAGIILLVTLFLRNGGLSLVVGIILFFTMMVAGDMVIFIALTTKSPLFIQAVALIFPNITLRAYYSDFTGLWTPTFPEILLYIGVSYFIVILLFIIGYLYFSRRFGL
jgi:hypothetical protein